MVAASNKSIPVEIRSHRKKMNNLPDMDRPDFEDALRPHYDDALRYCISLAAKTRKAEAEDLLQDALLKAILKYDQLKEASGFRPWFFQIITRTYFSQRRLKTWKRLFSIEEHMVQIPEVFNVFEMTEKRQLLMKALAQLKPRQRSAFLLFELSGFSLEEIQLIQGDRSKSAVKSRLSRARKKLKTIIQHLEQQRLPALQASPLTNFNEVIHETTEQGIDALNR